MIFHAVSIAAFFVDQVTQAPVVVQCAQVPPEPWWKWWVQSVIPVAGGTLIAIWSFVQNRTSEHEQWIRDQKGSEWRELLDKFNAV